MVRFGDDTAFVALHHDEKYTNRLQLFKLFLLHCSNLERLF